MKFLSIAMILCMFVFFFGLSDTENNQAVQEVQKKETQKPQPVRLIEDLTSLANRLDAIPFGMANDFKDNQPFEFITSKAIIDLADKLIYICEAYSYDSDHCQLGIIEFEYNTVPDFSYLYKLTAI